MARETRPKDAVPAEPLSGHAPKADATASGEPTLNMMVLLVYYLPLIYLCTVLFNATGMHVSNMSVGMVALVGTAVPALGLFVGVLQFRMDFLKGFLMHIVFCLPVTVLFFVMTAWVGVFGDFVNTREEILYLCMIPTLYVPIRYHTKKRHRHALGAAYAAPVGFMGIAFGTLFGWIHTYF